jgi:prophage regulatory protein
MNREVDVMRMLSHPDLREKGIKFSRQHLRRLIRQGKFPAPCKLGENTNAWPEAEIDKYLEDRIAARDQQAASTGLDKPLAQR